MGAFSNMDYELQNSEAAVSDAFTEDDANAGLRYRFGSGNALMPYKVFFLPYELLLMRS